jgi:hypothetical protein
MIDSGSDIILVLPRSLLLLTTEWMKVCRFLFTHYRPDAVAVIHVRTYYSPTGTVIPGTGFRTGSPPEADVHAIGLNGSYPAPGYVTRILLGGGFVEPAFAELAELVQEHGMDLETGAGQEEDMSCR